MIFREAEFEQSNTELESTEEKSSYSSTRGGMSHLEENGDGPQGWDASAAAELESDPRFEAGVALRKEGQYEDAIAFFAELLKTFDTFDGAAAAAEAAGEAGGKEPPTPPPPPKVPPYLAPLYFNYGSTLVCTL